MSITYQSRFDGLRIVTDEGQWFTLYNSNFVNGGGFGEVFKLDDDLVVKLYYDNPIKSTLREKLLTLCAQKDTFNELIVSPLQMVRIEGQQPSQASGYIMKYIPDAKPCTFMKWKNSISQSEEDIFDYTVANLIHDLSLAISSLHENRVFVCDLKPENILISELRPYIIDFDSCSIPNYQGESFTIQYLDPIIRGNVPDAVGSNEEFSALSDWWALAVISFEMFLGVSPWSGIHPQFRKDPLTFRSYNYSAVIFDPLVRPPLKELRNPEWLENKPKLKNYYKNIFSPDPHSRISIIDILDLYFPQEVEFVQEHEKVYNIMDRLLKDDRQRKFFETIWRDIVAKARKRALGKEQARIQLLDMMYSAE